MDESVSPIIHQSDSMETNQMPVSIESMMNGNNGVDCIDHAQATIGPIVSSDAEEISVQTVQLSSSMRRGRPVHSRGVYRSELTTGRVSMREVTVPAVARPMTSPGVDPSLSRSSHPHHRGPLSPAEQVAALREARGGFWSFGPSGVMFRPVSKEAKDPQEALKAKVNEERERLCSQQKARSMQSSPNHSPPPATSRLHTSTGARPGTSAVSTIAATADENQPNLWRRGQSGLHTKVPSSSGGFYTDDYLPGLPLPYVPPTTGGLLHSVYHSSLLPPGSDKLLEPEPPHHESKRSRPVAIMVQEDARMALESAMRKREDSNRRLPGAPQRSLESRTRPSRQHRRETRMFEQGVDDQDIEDTSDTLHRAKEFLAASYALPLLRGAHLCPEQFDPNLLLERRSARAKDAAYSHIQPGSQTARPAPTPPITEKFRFDLALSATMRAQAESQSSRPATTEADLVRARQQRKHEQERQFMHSAAGRPRKTLEQWEAERAAEMEQQHQMEQQDASLTRPHTHTSIEPTPPKSALQDVQTLLQATGKLPREHLDDVALTSVTVNPPVIEDAEFFGYLRVHNENRVPSHSRGQKRGSLSEKYGTQEEKQSIPHPHPRTHLAPVVPPPSNPHAEPADAPTQVWTYSCARLEEKLFPHAPTRSMYSSQSSRIKDDKVPTTEIPVPKSKAAEAERMLVESAWRSTNYKAKRARVPIVPAPAKTKTTNIESSPVVEHAVDEKSLTQDATLPVDEEFHPDAELTAAAPNHVSANKLPSAQHSAQHSERGSPSMSRPASRLNQRSTRASPVTTSSPLHSPMATRPSSRQVIDPTAPVTVRPSSRQTQAIHQTSDHSKVSASARPSSGSNLVPIAKTAHVIARDDELDQPDVPISSALVDALRPKSRTSPAVSAAASPLADIQAFVLAAAENPTSSVPIASAETTVHPSAHVGTIATSSRPASPSTATLKDAPVITATDTPDYPYRMVSSPRGSSAAKDASNGRTVFSASRARNSSSDAGSPHTRPRSTQHVRAAKSMGGTVPGDSLSQMQLDDLVGQWVVETDSTLITPPPELPILATQPSVAVEIEHAAEPVVVTSTDTVDPSAGAPEADEEFDLDAELNNLDASSTVRESANESALSTLPPPISQFVEHEPELPFEQSVIGSPVFVHDRLDDRKEPVEGKAETTEKPKVASRRSSLLVTRRKSDLTGQPPVPPSVTNTTAPGGHSRRGSRRASLSDSRRASLGNDAAIFQAKKELLADVSAALAAVFGSSKPGSKRGSKNGSQMGSKVGSKQGSRRASISLPIVPAPSASLPAAQSIAAPVAAPPVPVPSKPSLLHAATTPVPQHTPPPPSTLSPEEEAAFSASRRAIAKEKRLARKLRREQGSLASGSSTGSDASSLIISAPQEPEPPVPQPKFDIHAELAALYADLPEVPVDEASEKENAESVAEISITQRSSLPRKRHVSGGSLAGVMAVKSFLPKKKVKRSTLSKERALEFVVSSDSEDEATSAAGKDESSDEEQPAANLTGAAAHVASAITPDPSSSGGEEGAGVTAIASTAPNSTRPSTSESGPRAKKKATPASTPSPDKSNKPLNSRRRAHAAFDSDSSTGTEDARVSARKATKRTERVTMASKRSSAGTPAGTVAVPSTATPTTAVQPSADKRFSFPPPSVPAPTSPPPPVRPTLESRSSLVTMNAFKSANKRSSMASAQAEYNPVPVPPSFAGGSPPRSKNRASMRERQYLLEQKRAMQDAEIAKRESEENAIALAKAEKALQVSSTKRLETVAAIATVAAAVGGDISPAASIAEGEAKTEVQLAVLDASLAAATALSSAPPTPATASIRMTPRTPLSPSTVPFLVPPPTEPEFDLDAVAAEPTVSVSAESTAPTAVAEETSTPTPGSSVPTAKSGGSPITSPISTGKKRLSKRRASKHTASPAAPTATPGAAATLSPTTGRRKSRLTPGGRKGRASMITKEPTLAAATAVPIQYDEEGLPILITPELAQAVGLDPALAVTKSATHSPKLVAEVGESVLQVDEPALPSLVSSIDAAITSVEPDSTTNDSENFPPSSLIAITIEPPTSTMASPEGSPDPHLVLPTPIDDPLQAQVRAMNLAVLASLAGPPTPQNVIDSPIAVPILTAAELDAAAAAASALFGPKVIEMLREEESDSSATSTPAGGTPSGQASRSRRPSFSQHPSRSRSRRGLTQQSMDIAVPSAIGSPPPDSDTPLDTPHQGEPETLVVV